MKYKISFQLDEGAFICNKSYSGGLAISHKCFKADLAAIGRHFEFQCE